MENWKSIPNYPKYMASDLGNIKNAATGHIMSIQTGKDGYQRVIVRQSGKTTTALVHNLVASAFISKPSPEHNRIRHKDNNKENNIPDNLYWVSFESCIHGHVFCPETNTEYKSITQAASKINAGPSGAARVYSAIKRNGAVNVDGISYHFQLVEQNS